LSVYLRFEKNNSVRAENDAKTTAYIKYKPVKTMVNISEVS